MHRPGERRQLLPPERLDHATEAPVIKVVATASARCYHPEYQISLHSGDRVMSDQPRPHGDSLFGALLLRVDKICDRFEEAWKAGQRPPAFRNSSGGMKPGRYLAR
jgi:hypothetical protein